MRDSDRLTADLIVLAKDKTSQELLGQHLRVMHTSQRAPAGCRYNQLVSISHVGESVLSQMRDGVLLLSPEIATALLAMADALRRTVQIGTSGDEGVSDYSTVVEQLSQILNGSPAAPKAGPQPSREAQVLQIRAKNIQKNVKKK